MSAPFSVRRALAAHWGHAQGEVDLLVDGAEPGTRSTVLRRDGRLWTATKGRSRPRERRWEWEAVPSAVGVGEGWRIWRNRLTEPVF